jgi:hypothetical protein
MRSLDSNVHRFKLEPPTEYAAAHDPVVDFKQVFFIGYRPKNHCADETIVADPI